MFHKFLLIAGWASLMQFRASHSRARVGEKSVLYARQLQVRVSIYWSVCSTNLGSGFRLLNVLVVVSSAFQSKWGSTASFLNFSSLLAGHCKVWSHAMSTLDLPGKDAFHRWPKWLNLEGFWGDTQLIQRLSGNIIGYVLQQSHVSQSPHQFSGFELWMPFCVPCTEM